MPKLLSIIWCKVSIAPNVVLHSENHLTRTRNKNKEPCFNRLPSISIIYTPLEVHAHLFPLSRAPSERLDWGPESACPSPLLPSLLPPPPRDLSRVARLRACERSHRKKAHFVSQPWVQDSIEGGYLKPERSYEPHSE